jgi:hypothetical protein
MVESGKHGEQLLTDGIAPPETRSARGRTVVPR